MSATTAGNDLRIIPAYAGSTSNAAKSQPKRSDHPRLRGEHVWSYYPLRDGNRIIPAYAGSTPIVPQ